MPSAVYDLWGEWGLTISVEIVHKARYIDYDLPVNWNIVC